MSREEKDCTIKVEVKYSDEAERDGFVSMWSYQLLDRHNADWAFQYLVRHMGRTGDQLEEGTGDQLEEGTGASKELAGYLMKIADLRKELGKLKDSNQSLRAECNRYRYRNEYLENTDLSTVAEENKALRITLNRIVSMGTEILNEC